jgi:hypothetical protein
MEWWNILATILGIIGGLLGIFSFIRVVKRQNPKFNITTKSPAIIFGSKEKAEFLIFEATISNLSDLANSCIEYGLIISHPYSISTPPIHCYETRYGKSVLETEDGQKKHAIKGKKIKWISTPANLAAHTTDSGFIGFPLPSIPIDIVKAVEYTLIVMPSEGQPQLIPFFLNDLIWETSEEISIGFQG